MPTPPLTVTAALGEATTLVHRWCEARHLDAPDPLSVARPGYHTALPPVAEDRLRRLSRMAAMSGDADEAARLLAALREALDF